MLILLIFLSILILPTAPCPHARTIMIKRKIRIKVFREIARGGG
jgi:hypothetical protein